MPSRRPQAGSTLIWLILWLAGMAAIAYWCVARHAPALQQQIIGNAQAAISGAGADNVDLSVVGRSATLSGVVANDSRKDQILAAVGDADGIRVVNDQLTIAGQTDNPEPSSSAVTNKAETADETQQADAAPDQNTEDGSTNNAADTEQSSSTSPDKAAAPTTAQTDESASGSTEAISENETEAAPELTDALDTATTPSVNEADEQPRVLEETATASESIEVAELVVEPEQPVKIPEPEPVPEPQPEAEAEPVAESKSELERELELEPELEPTLVADSVEAKALALIEQARQETLNPLIDPQTPLPNNGISQKSDTTSLSDAQRSVAATELPSLLMKVDQGTLTLTGDISDQDSLLNFIRSAMSTFDANYVVNSVQVHDYTAQAEWLPALNRFLPDMRVISNAGIEIIGSQITLSGVATDDTAHDKVIDKALFELGELSLVERISVSNESQTESTAPAASQEAKPAATISSGNSTSDEPSVDSQRATLSAEFASLESSKILFESGSDVLTDESLQVIESMAQLFAAYPIVNIEIDGHTDASGVSANNLQLSQLRANAVRDYLVKQGIAAERLSAYGFGDGVPIADNSTPAGRRLNRRIEFNF